MVALPGGGEHAQPGPLEEKHFAGELECDFEAALKMVQAAGAPAGRGIRAVARQAERRGGKGVWGSLRRLLGWGRNTGGALRQDRHVAFDGFRNPLHDEKTERDRRYGTVYTVVEHSNAYLVSLELPRRIPASSLKELWRLPDEMPDYDYSISLHGDVLAVRAGVRGEAMRRLPYVSASFPADFLTRIEFQQPVGAFKHRLRDKVLEIVVIKARAEAASGVASAGRAASLAGQRAEPVAKMMRVREATDRDLPRILEIERLCFAQPWTLDSFRRELLLPFSRILVAVENGVSARDQPVGFLCRWMVADECHILNIAVHPDYRRHGIATMLMGQSISEAKAKESEFVTLEVRRSNLAARRLYRKLNFEEQRLRRNYYGPGEDAIVMELNLKGGRR